MRIAKTFPRTYNLTQGAKKRMLRIRMERLSRRWNQTALAFRAGMSVPDVSRIETGRMKPYPGQAERLARALDLTPEALLEEVGEFVSLTAA